MHTPKGIMGPPLTGVMCVVSLVVCVWMSRHLWRHFREASSSRGAKGKWHRRRREQEGSSRVKVAKRMQHHTFHSGPPPEYC